MPAENTQKVFLLARRLRPRSFIFAFLFSIPSLLIAMNYHNTTQYYGTYGLYYCLFIFAMTGLLWILVFSLNRIKTYVTTDEMVMTDILGRKIRVKAESIVQVEIIAGFWSAVFGGRIIKIIFDKNKKLIIGPFEETEEFIRCLYDTMYNKAAESGKQAAVECVERLKKELEEKHGFPFY